jgi:hypothetical protein
MRFPKPNARFEHVFVIVRSSPRDGRDVTLTKAFWTEEAAQREADRLNTENSGHWSYEVQVARLVPSDDPAD